MTNRKLVLDTETTGLTPDTGHKITEIGIVEMINNRKTGRVFQKYIDPGFEISDEVQAITNMSRTDLIEASGGQTFADIAHEFLDFVRGGELVIHNAPFDMKFLDAEFERLGMPKLSGTIPVFDTLAYANDQFPGRRNSLDFLCRRLGVNNAHRDYHGALLDSEILVDVYLILIQNQNSLDLSQGPKPAPQPTTRTTLQYPPVQIAGADCLPIITPDSDEVQNHHNLMQRIKKESNDNNQWPGM